MTRSWCLTRVAALALVLSGCGLGDYETKMVEAQKRLARHEEEERLLGPAIVIPNRDDGKGNREPIGVIHLRLPKGLANTAGNEASPRARGVAKLYTFGPTAAGGAGAFKAVELAVAGDEKDFVTDLTGLFDQTSNPTTKTRAVRGPGREAVTFEVTEFENGADVVAICLNKGAKEQVAVVYRYAKAQQQAAARATELSLESFGVGEQAHKARVGGASPLKVPRK